MSEWYEIYAAWDASGSASDALLKLGETREWCELMNEAATSTHATVDEVYDGMAKALRDYLESLDNLQANEEIVRCRDCERFAVDKSDHEYRSGWWCTRWSTDMVKPDGFCAWGERRES